MSFTINSGEIVGFLGPNGAGKSTTMNILTGYLSATDGSVKIDGVDILEDPTKAKKMIGFLPELPPLYMDMTVREYLGFVYDLKKCKFPKEPHIREICELIQITDVYNRMIKNLSKGYRQRVGLAQALVGNPDVLILDEVTQALSLNNRKTLYRVIDRLKEQGKSVIFISHDLEEVMEIADSITVLRDGEVVGTVQTAEISLDQLKRMMIGRDMVGHYYREDNDVIKLLQKRGMEGDYSWTHSADEYVKLYEKLTAN